MSADDPLSDGGGDDRHEDDSEQEATPLGQRVGTAAQEYGSVAADRTASALRTASEHTRRANTVARAGLSTSVDTLREYEWLTAAQTTAYVVVLAPLLLVSQFLSVLPPAWKVWHKIHRWSAYQMQKASNADTLANVRLSNGHEDVLPAAWTESEEDEKDRTGWNVKGLGDKRYDSAIHGRTTTRLGKANIIHINEDDTEQATWAEAAIDNALQLNREQYLFRDATLVAQQATVVGQNGQQAEQAVADGGAVNIGDPIQIQDVSIEKPGICQDILVPVGSREGYDGQVVSWPQVQSLKKDKSDQDTVRDAKNQAWAAAKLDEIEGKDLFKWVLIIGLWSGVLLFHQEIGAFIAGLSGGGGGGGGAVGDALGMLAPVGLRGGI